jgi:hypothetical protein
MKEFPPVQTLGNSIGIEILSVGMGIMCIVPNGFGYKILLVVAAHLMQGYMPRDDNPTPTPGCGYPCVLFPVGLDTKLYS